MLQENTAQLPSSPFLDKGAMSMAELIARIQDDDSLPLSRRSNLASSARRLCEVLGVDPASAPANHWQLRERLKRFHPVEAGLTPKRFATIKSDVTFAFRHLGLITGQRRGFAAYSTDWQRLKDEVPDTSFNWGLARLARYCSNKGIQPLEVDDSVIADYLDAIRKETFKTSPERLVREVCHRWNKLGSLRPQFGLKTVSLPSHRDTYTKPWEQLPVSFQEGVERWLDTMSKEADLLSLDGPIRALRPGSIATYRYNMRQAFAALEASGVPAEQITSPQVLISDGNPRRVLEFFLRRNGNKPTSAVAGMAHVLLSFARHGCAADTATIATLERFRKQLAVKRTGLRERPKAALRQFADARNLDRLLLLPLRLHERLRKKVEMTIEYARLMQIAVALELLLMRPIRRANLVALRFNQNIIRSGRGVFISLPATEVKNNVELDYRVPAESVALLDFYKKDALPLFGPNPMEWLFPGANPQKHKSPEQFGRFFLKTIRDETGLYVYPHVLRHLGALLYLKENPGQFEIVRRLLAHKSLQTTTNSYVSSDEEAALRAYDNLVLRMRNAIGTSDVE